MTEIPGEPEYGDQVTRHMRYREAHPGTEIRYHGPHWQAIVPEENGETVITRLSLKKLLDKLESLAAEGATYHPGG